MFRLGLNFFISFLSFVRVVSFVSSCNISIRDTNIARSFLLSFIFLSTIVQLVMIDERKHGEQRNTFDNRECEDKQNCEDIHS